MAKCYNQIYIAKNDILVNCGKCLNCISNKKRDYGLRASVEIEKYPNKVFATLTYNEMEVPYKVKDEKIKLSLSEEHARNFIKRVRQQLKRDFSGNEFKYFMAGEYGGDTERPHYHIVAGSNGAIASTIKNKWESGNVKLEKLISRKAVSYTVGYTDKKIYSKAYKGIEEPFHKFSVGMGKDWFYKQWQEGKITAEHYYIETHNYIQALPIYFKNLIKKEFYMQDLINFKIGYNDKIWGKHKMDGPSWMQFKEDVKNKIDEEKLKTYESDLKYMRKKYGENAEVYRNTQGLLNLLTLHEAKENIEEIYRLKQHLLDFNAKISQMDARNKLLENEAKAKFWMRAKLRDAV